MDGILLVIAVGLAGACWWLWSERERYQQDNENLKLENGRLKLAHDTLRADFSQKDKMLSSVTAEYGQFKDNTLVTLTAASSELEHTAHELLPYLEEDPNEILLRMSADDIAKTDLPFSHEFMQMLTQLAATKGEAVTSLNTALLRLMYIVKLLVAQGRLNAPTVNFLAKHLQQMQDLMRSHVLLLNTPGFKDYYVKSFAITMDRLMAAYQGDDDDPSAESLDLWTAAYDTLLAESPASAATTPVAEPTAEASPEVETATFSVNGHGAQDTMEGASAYGQGI